MYAISFRIPFTVLGTTQYVNGAFPSKQSYRPGTKVAVTSDDVSHMIGEVILSINTKRDPGDFKWAEFIA